ncbi:hypothetical protein [uncultured Aquimonas sp.]|uniref:hypothetical protein n=1 Tax=uncultured Aquimonas sp. TaxID=385483 RepID=UPI00086DDEA2|nr:hypothetical protein [uncultured Aquimonas sp.]ODU44691.1 MAG: hypothetical protein ABS96_17850 [Xanthomonadaceae bacterium SCN 69-123]
MPKPASKQPIDLKRILGVVLGIAALAWWTLDRAEYFISRSILVAYGDFETTFRGAWFEWDGDLYAKDFRIVDEETGEAVLRAKYVVAETPGWFWVMRNLIFQKRQHRIRVDRIHLELLDVEAHADLGDPSLGDLGPFSADVASPWDAEGCSDLLSFGRFQLADLGLSPGPAKLVFDYRINGRDLDAEVLLQVPGVSQVRVTRKEEMLGGSNALVLDYLATQIHSERIEIEDLGFVAARNQQCAKTAGIDEATFVQRHMESLQRIFAHYGLSVDAASTALYREFVARGGTLAAEVRYAPPLDSEEFYGLRQSMDVLPRLNMSLERAGRSVPVQLAQVRERPLDGFDSALSTWRLIEREQEALARANGPGGSRPLASLGGSGGARSGRSVQPARANTSAAAAGATAASSAALAAADSLEAVPASRPAAPANGAADAEWQPEYRDPSALQWEELKPLVGEQLRVFTRHSGGRVVELIEHRGSELRVRAALGGGSAEYTIQREAFQFARRL